MVSSRLHYLCQVHQNHNYYNSSVSHRKLTEKSNKKLKKMAYPFLTHIKLACQTVNTRSILAHPAFVSEWKWFLEGRIKGEIFLIHPLAVVKWHLTKATLPKSAKSQVVSLNHSRIQLLCWLQHMLDSHCSVGLFYPLMCPWWVLSLDTVHIAMNMARNVLTGALQGHAY